MFVSFTRREYQLIKILLDILRHTFLNVRARYLVARKHFQISRQTKTPNPSSSSLSHSLKPQLHRIVCLRKTQSANDLKANPIVRNRGRNFGLKIISRPSHRQRIECNIFVMQSRISIILSTRELAGNLCTLFARIVQLACILRRGIHTRRL